jgi:AcrR family transcriptional regulator
VAAEKLDTRARREQLAQAVLDLIAERGPEDLNLAAVARRVGLVPSAIYRHFRSKDEVVDAALDLIGARLLANVSAVRTDAGDPLTRLERLLFRHAQLIRENRAIPRIVLSGEVYSGHPERRAKIYGFVQTYLAEVARLVREGQEGGQIDPDLNPETLSVCFLGLIQSPAILWQLSDGAFDATKHLERAWKIFAGAIGGTPAPRRSPSAPGRPGRRGQDPPARH